MTISTGRFDADGRTVYAVGDIHGRDDLFGSLLDRIDADFALHPGQGKPMLILLGDYVDRGPASRQVIDRILGLRDAGRYELRCLLGNHEEAMLDFLDRRTAGPGWLKHGGGPTMLSYGVRPPLAEADRSVWTAAREKLREAVPPAHDAFLRGLDLVIEVGSFLFVHAGLRPGVPMGEQTQRDMLWIRNSFLEVDHGFGRTIVHGHTPSDRVFVSERRIGLDTGAYATGMLSAVRLGRGEPTVLQVRAGLALRRAANG